MDGNLGLLLFESIFQSHASAFACPVRRNILNDNDWQGPSITFWLMITQPFSCYICSPAALLTTSAVKSGIDRNGE